MPNVNFVPAQGAVDLDELMTPERFAAWQGRPVAWVMARLASLPGVIRESREHVRIHPRTYLAARLGQCR